VEESSVKVMAGALAVKLATAVGQVKLLDNSEHVVVCKNISGDSSTFPKKDGRAICGDVAELAG
jgi:hypothetical protein